LSIFQYDEQFFEKSSFYKDEIREETGRRQREGNHPFELTARETGQKVLSERLVFFGGMN